MIMEDIAFSNYSTNQKDAKLLARMVVTSTSPPMPFRIRLVLLNMGVGSSVGRGILELESGNSLPVLHPRA